MTVRQGTLPLSVIASIGLAISLAAIALAVPNPASVSATASARASATALGQAATSVPTARASAAVFAMTLSDDDLTRAAASGFPQTVNGVTVRDPQVRVESASVRLVAKAAVLFGTTQFVMNATPVVTDGQLSVRVDSATLAGMSLPESTRASIRDTVQSTIARLLPVNVRVMSVALSPGALTVQGVQR